MGSVAHHACSSSNMICRSTLTGEAEGGLVVKVGAAEAETEEVRGVQVLQG